MQKDETYHTSAIQYNDELAAAADDLANRLEHPTIAGWSQSVAKQHKFHAGRHRKALAKIQTEDDTKTADTEDGGEDRVVEESVQEQQRRFAEEQTQREAESPPVPSPAQVAEAAQSKGA